MIDAPTPEQLPVKRRVALRGGPTLGEFTVALKLVTPILGGGTRTREIDDVDVIRAPTIRGHLRFWWRALHGHGYATTRELAVAEGSLWGHAAGDEGGRSRVEISVTECVGGDVVTSNPEPGSQGFYALWPAREQRRTDGREGKPTAPRRKAGATFKLRVQCPDEVRGEVENAVRAWVLFGGYGSRTRRGLGSMTVTGGEGRWLPKGHTREALTELFGRDVMAVEAGRPLGDLPLLRGAGLIVGHEGSAELSWSTALTWLSDFRQGPPANARPGTPNPNYDPNYARERAPAVPWSRAGRSNWPESDKIRNLSGRGPWAHASRHNREPVWPRAGFGLPIVGQFQKQNRQRGFYNPMDPTEYELRWRGAQGGKAIERLASPLIVKALPLASGKFVPCALWLFRGYPAGGSVCLTRQGVEVSGSAAPFDLLVAPGDDVLYAPLAVPDAVPAGMRLRTAFMHWLRAQPGLAVVAP